MYRKLCRDKSLLRRAYELAFVIVALVIIAGEWWQTDLGQIDKSLAVGFFGFNPSSATLNGKLGDLNNCSSGNHLI